MKNEMFDVIVPMYEIKEDVNSYIENWFKELPINKLILGIGKDDLKIPHKYKDYIITVDQKKNKTLGKCLVELMKKVETEWFIFLHSDAKITEYAFGIMKKYMMNDVGGIEGSPIVVKYENRKLKHFFHSRIFIKRAYSGFQLFRTVCVQEIIEKIEDDYVFTNEDLIIQNAVTSLGYEYKKTWAIYLHYNEGLRKKTEKNAKDMFLGLIKYTHPDKIVESLIDITMKFYHTTFKHIDPDEIIKFTKQNNLEWLTHIKKSVNRFK